MQLKDKIALVTGASRGIGRAVAIALAQAGATVVCTSTRSGGCAATLAAIAAAAGKGEEIAADVGDRAQVEQLAKTLLERHGRLDCLVNNAGITRDGVFLRMADDDFDQVLATNLRGP